MTHLSEEELLDQLEKASQLVEIDAFYTHYRNPNSRYKVVSLGIIEATQEVGVFYKKEIGSNFLKSITWVRPLSSWLEELSVEDGKMARFQKAMI